MKRFPTRRGTAGLVTLLSTMKNFRYGKHYDWVSSMNEAELLADYSRPLVLIMIDNEITTSFHFVFNTGYLCISLNGSSANQSLTPVSREIRVG